MGGWPAIIKEALEWLRKAAPALFAYLAGREKGRRSAEEKAREEKEEASEKQDEKNRDYERLRRNKPLRERMRDIMRKKRAARNGDVQE